MSYWPYSDCMAESERGFGDQIQHFYTNLHPHHCRVWVHYEQTRYFNGRWCSCGLRGDCTEDSCDGVVHHNFRPPRPCPYRGWRLHWIPTVVWWKPWTWGTGYNEWREVTQ